MGNDLSKASKKSIKNFGSIEIKTERTLFSVDEPIRGTVILHLTNSFPQPNFIIQIKGIEKAVIFSNQGQQLSKEKNKGKGLKEKLILVKNQIVVKSPEANQFPVGRYSYPFSFTLDPQVPPSFYHETNTSSEKFIGKIAYKISAGLFDEKTESLLIKNMPITLTSNRVLFDTDLTHTSRIKPPTISSLIWENSVELIMNLNDSRLFTGKSFNLIVGADATKSKNSIYSLCAELEQVVSVCVKGLSKKSIIPIWKYTAVDVTVKKGTSKVGVNGYRLVIPPQITQDLAESVSSMNVGNNYRLVLKIPQQDNFWTGLADKQNELVVPIQVSRGFDSQVQRVVYVDQQMRNIPQSNQPAPPLTTNQIPQNHNPVNLNSNTHQLPTNRRDQSLNVTNQPPIQSHEELGIPFYCVNLDHVEPYSEPQQYLNMNTVEYPSLEPDQMI